MNPRVWVLGRGRIEPEEPFVVFDDLGLTRGDGCFDTALAVRRCDGFELLAWDRHLARLGRSAASLGIDCPSPGLWREGVDALLQDWGDDEGVFKFVLTRGQEWSAGDPLGYIVLFPVGDAMIRERCGLTLATLDSGRVHDAFVDKPWLLGRVKTLSYATNLAARREAMSRGADDALLISSDGFVLESPTAGIVWHRDGHWGTTQLDGTGILDSVTVSLIADGAAQSGEAFEWGLLRVDDVPLCDGLWSVSCGRGAAPVTAVDGQPLPGDAELTQRLLGWIGFDRLSGVARWQNCDHGQD